MKSEIIKGETTLVLTLDQKEASLLFAFLLAAASAGDEFLMSIQNATEDACECNVDVAYRFDSNSGYFEPSDADTSDEESF